MSSGRPRLLPHFTTCPFCALPRCKCQYTNSHLKAQLKTQTERKCEQAEQQGSRGRVGEGVVKVAAGAVLNECQGGCLTHAPKKGQTGARPENSVTCLMKVASVRNANRQGRGPGRARQNPDDYFGTTIVYSEVKSLPKRGRGLPIILVAS